MSSKIVFTASSMVVLAASLGGCAAPKPTVKLVVTPAQLARHTPSVVQPLLDAHANAVRVLDDEAQHDDERVTKARAALAGVQSEPAGNTPAVHDAKLERARAELAWQLTLAGEVPWRRAVEQAAFERDKAALLYHTGGDLDLDAYKDQCNRARVGLRAQDEKQVAARKRFETADQRLNAAKVRYVDEMRASAKP